MDKPLWEFEHVQLRGTLHPRLMDVSLSIYPGRTAVLGPSGAGKSSLLNILVGFANPDGGNVLCNVEADGHSLPLYWVPQNTGLWLHLTVREHLLTVMPRQGGDARQRVSEILASLDISEKADAYPEELSPGERSRLSVARALAADANVLVLDEPLVHVDTVAAARYWKVIDRHLRDGDRSMVFATHVPMTVLAEAERVICLKDAEVLYVGGVHELYWQPESSELAECLGECNWLTPEEAELWLGQGESNGRCYRPEQIAIRSAVEGSVVVRSSRFKGSLAEVELEHHSTGSVRRFYHRPSGDGLKAGQKVALKLLALLLMLCLFGCGSSREPVLAVGGLSYWQMPPQSARIPSPRSITIGANGEAIVLDTAGRVLVFDRNGRLSRSWKMPETEVGKPEGLCVLANGQIAVADTHYHQLVFFDPSGKLLRQLGRFGKGPGEFLYPVSITEDDRNNIYVCEYGGNDRVQKFAPDGTFLLSFGSFGTDADQFQRPSGIVWFDHKLYVADAINNRIQVFSEDGKFLKTLGSEERPWSLHFPYDIALSDAGTLFVVEYGAGRVTHLDVNGELLGRFGSVGGGPGRFNTPWGIAVEGALRVLVADTGNARIVELKL